MAAKPFCLTADEIEKRLIKAGVRPTSQRITIARYVLCEGNHVTVDEVMTWAHANCDKVSAATVYNTLKVLVKIGLLAQRSFDHLGKVVYDSLIIPHHHFLDKASGVIHDIELEKVEVKTKNLGDRYILSDTEVFLIGTIKKRKT